MLNFAAGKVPKCNQSLGVPETRACVKEMTLVIWRLIVRPRGRGRRRRPGNHIITII